VPGVPEGRWPEYLAPVLGRYGGHPLHLGLAGWLFRLGRDGQLPCRLSHLPDEILDAAIALALDFQTWRTLVRQQELSKDRAVELIIGMVSCLMWT
jgi:hypothetical protein